MSRHRNTKLDLAALGLLVLTAFLAAALVSHDPADPPGGLVVPGNPEPTNLCGRFGALVARALLDALGVGAYYLVVSLGALDATLLMRGSLSQPVLRLFGWLLSLAGISALGATALAGWAPAGAIGAGGYLGATARGWLSMHFAAIGAYILMASMVVGGLLLATDYLVARLFRWLVAAPARRLGRGVLEVSGAYAERLARRRSDLDDLSGGADNHGEADEGVAVRIAGRGSQRDANEDEQSDGEPDEDDEPATDDEAAEEPKVGQTARTGYKGLASLLGVARRGADEKKRLVEEIDRDRTDLAVQPGDYQLPGLDLLLAGETFSFEEHEKEVRRKARVLEKTFADFGFKVRVVEIQTGPVIAQFEVELEAGLRLSKITGLADDLAIALRVPSVRIVAPLPGKNTVGVEVPNNDRQLVRLREVIEEANGRAAKMRIPLFLGKDVAGNPLIVDLTTLPHLLIAGRTGTGKSVCLNSIIVSMLMTRRPDEVRLLLIDPKMVELSPYRSLPHLMHPVVTDMRKAEAILAWAVEKMEERYHLLARAGVRHVSVYNQLGEEELMERIQPEDEEERRQIPTHMPYVVIVADELADLMMTAAKEVESHIIRLAQKSRAVGIHLVLATQKPTVDVITGLIKSNLPARISFQVASRTDSRVVLDEMGAERLLGNGDMLFLWPGTSTLIRGQGTYLSDDEINNVIAAVATTEPQFVKELVHLPTSGSAAQPGKGFQNRDDLYESAVEVVIREGRGSVSLLQRALGIGYGRAARLIDFMAEDGIVGPYNGSQARDVLLSLSDWESRNAPPESDSPRPASARAGGAAPPSRAVTAEVTTPPKESASVRRSAGGRLSDAPGASPRRGHTITLAAQDPTRRAAWDEDDEDPAHNASWDEEPDEDPENDVDESVDEGDNDPQQPDDPAAESSDAADEDADALSGNEEDEDDDGSSDDEEDFTDEDQWEDSAGCEEEAERAPRRRALAEDEDDEESSEAADITPPGGRSARAGARSRRRRA